MKLKEYKCNHCGKSFFEYGNPKYCSRDCFNETGTFSHRIPHTSETKKRISITKKANPTETQFKNGHPFIKGGEKGWFSKGSKPWNYQGGIRSISQKIKDDVRWNRWRNAIFKRDDFTCQECKRRGCYLQPHHIKSKAKYPELAFDIDNGITLCVECHRKTDNYGGKLNGH